MTTLKPTKDYWQVPLKAPNNEKIVFNTPRGLYPFVAMPFEMYRVDTTLQCFVGHIFGYAKNT